MKPVFQTRFGRPLGNCWAASIASLLEVPLESVDWSADMTAEEIEPPGTDDVSVEWLRRKEEALRRLGYWESRVPWSEQVIAQLPAGAHYLALGYIANGAGHVCVYRDGVLVHDPHPEVGGLVSIDSLCFLVRA